MEIYKRGSSGEIVKQIQKALHLLPDGIYGIQTEEAVRAFQLAHHITPDGIVGAKTLALLIPQRLKRSKREIAEIIVHCSATPEGKDFTVDDIRRWHKQQGWSDIGYHYVIGRHGELWTGRDVDVQGAHCAAGGHNRRSIGVCYVGGCARDGKTAKDTRTLAQKATMLSLLIDLKKLYPQAQIYGHHDFERNKECPSFDARTEYKKI